MADRLDAGFAHRAPRALMLLTAVLLAGVVAAAPLAAEAADDGTGITVDVQDDSETPSPSPTAGTTTQGPSTGGSSGYSGTGSGSSSGQSGAGDPDQPSGSTPGTEETSAPGKRLAVVVDGLELENRSSINPLDGALAASVVIANLSNETITVEALFWADNALGIRLDSASSRATLAPGEQQKVAVTLEGLWQSGIVNVSAKVTPPKTIGGAPQTPVTREAWTLLIPWALVALIAACAGGWAVFRRMRGAG